jgi:hypothetical protein
MYVRVLQCGKGGVWVRPHPQGRKRFLVTKSLVQLTTRGGICASQSDRSAQSHDSHTSGLCHYSLYKFECADLLTNQIRALFKLARIGARPEPAIGPKSPDPFPSFLGSGWGARLRDWVKWHKQHQNFRVLLLQGFRFRVSSRVKFFRGAVLATDPRH